MKFQLTVLAILVCGCGQNANQDKLDFLAVVKKNVQDPADLTIVEWGEKKEIKNDQEREGYFGRVATVRCKLIDYEPGTKNPISLDTADIRYKKDGTLRSIHLERCRQSMYP